MLRQLKIWVVVLMVGMIVPAFALDEVAFSEVLKTAVNAEEYLYSLMEPGLSKTSPEFRAALESQKNTRIAIANEINALETKVALEKALIVARSFSEKAGSSQGIGRLAESLIASRLQFINAHQFQAGSTAFGSAR